MNDSDLLIPHKIVGKLIGARYNEDGAMTSEEVMGEVVIYRVNFDKVGQLVDEAVASAQSQNGSRPDV